MKNLATLSKAILIGSLLMGTSIPAYAAINNDKSASFVRDAENYLKKGDINAAVIQLKNAVVADPKNPQIRASLADLYLEMKNALSAEKEYMRALDLGIEPSKIMINLSKTRLLQRQYQMVLDTLHEKDIKEADKGEVYLIIGNAYQGLNNLDKALEYFKKGEKIKGKDDRIGVAIAQIYYFNKEMEKSEKKVDDVLVINPKNIEGIILKGELVNLRSGPEKSLPYFEQALEYDPKNISALFKASAILFDLKRSDEALAKLDIIFSIIPKHPLANYLSAVIYAQKNELDKAEEFLVDSGSALDNFPGALMLKGVINYTKKNYAQAIYNLDRLIKIAPENIVARRLLGASLLRQDDAEQAIKVLMPLVDNGKAGSVTYALLGSANMKLRHYEKGTEFFGKAAEINPNESRLKTQLALSRLASGNPEAAQADLHDILEKDPNSKQAAVFMTLISLREKDFDTAIINADILIKQDVKNPVGYNLKGTAYLRQKENDKARAQFNKALEISPTYYSASMNLAQLEQQEGHDDKALEIYNNILKANKDHTGAMLALAQYYQKNKDFGKAEKYYMRVVKTTPNNILARVGLSEFYVRQNKLDRAKAITQQIIIDFPDSPVGYEADGNIDLMSKDISSAVMNFEKMAALLGNSGGAYQLLGRAQLADNDPSAAKKSFLKGLSFSKNKIPLIIDLATLELTQKNYDKAQEYIEQIKKINDKDIMAYILEGRILSAQGRYVDSLVSYLKASEFGAKGSQFTIDLARAYISAGHEDKAVDIMKAHLVKEPKDLAVRHVLAGYYLQVRAFDKSIAQYEAILKLSTKNPIALNNIAWLYSKTKQPKKARKTAEKAYNLFPKEASFMDTYAWILVQQGENDKGLELLQDAVTKAPNMVEIRYHYAVSLNNAGRKAVAKKELETVMASGRNFSGIEDARKLLKALSQ